MYSQYEEERHILAACGSIVAGRFLDIGAWNPREFSNTRALFERGWSGIMVEPSPEPFLALLKEYGHEPRITLILAAVGVKAGLVKLHASADAISTTQEEHYQQWNGPASYQGDIWVPQLTVTDLLAAFPGPLDVLSIDTEGTSAEILFSLDLGPTPPRAICVEHDGRAAECGGWGQQRGYRPVYLNGTNLVLVR